MHSANNPIHSVRLFNRWLSFRLCISASFCFVTLVCAQDGRAQDGEHQSSTDLLTNEQRLEKYTSSHPFAERELYPGHYAMPELFPLYKSKFAERVQLSPEQVEKIFARFDLVFRKLRSIDQGVYGPKGRNSSVIKNVTVIRQAEIIKKSFADYVTKEVMTGAQFNQFRIAQFRNRLKQDGLRFFLDFYECNQHTGVEFQAGQINNLLSRATELAQDYREQRLAIGKQALLNILGDRRIQVLESRLEKPIHELANPLSVHRLTSVFRVNQPYPSFAKQMESSMEPRVATSILRYLPEYRLATVRKRVPSEVDTETRRKVARALLAAQKALQQMEEEFATEGKEMTKELIKRKAAKTLREFRTQVKTWVGEKKAQALELEFELTEINNFGLFQFVVDQRELFEMDANEVPEFVQKTKTEADACLQLVDQLHKRTIDQLLEHLDPAEKKKWLNYVGPDYYTLFGEKDIFKSLDTASQKIIR